MSIYKNIIGFITSADLFAQPIDFSYKDKKYFATFCGGCTSIIIGSVLLFYTIFLINNVFVKSFPIIIENDYYSDNPPIINIIKDITYTNPNQTKYEIISMKNETFYNYLSIGFQDANGNFMVINNGSFFTLSMYEISRKNGSNNKRPLNYSLCPKFDVFDTVFQNLNLSSTYCLNDSYSFFGNLNNNDYSYLQIIATKCNSSNKNIICNNLTNLNSTKMNYYYISNILNLTSFDQAVTTSVQSIYWDTLEGIKKHSVMKMSVNKLISYESILPKFLSTKFNQFHALVTGQFVDSIRKTDDDNIFFQLDIFSDSNTKTFTRTYSNLFSELSNVGGILNVITPIGIIFVFYFAYFRLDESLANDIYNIIPPENNKKLKISFEEFVKQNFHKLFKLEFHKLKKDCIEELEDKVQEEIQNQISINITNKEEDQSELKGELTENKRETQQNIKLNSNQLNLSQNDSKQKDEKEIFHSKNLNNLNKNDIEFDLKLRQKISFNSKIERKHNNENIKNENENCLNNDNLEEKNNINSNKEEKEPKDEKIKEENVNIHKIDSIDNSSKKQKLKTFENDNLINNSQNVHNNNDYNFDFFDNIDGEKEQEMNMLEKHIDLRIIEQLFLNTNEKTREKEVKELIIEILKKGKKLISIEKEEKELQNINKFRKESNNSVNGKELQNIKEKKEPNNLYDKLELNYEKNEIQFSKFRILFNLLKYKTYDKMYFSTIEILKNIFCYICAQKKYSIYKKLKENENVPLYFKKDLKAKNEKNINFYKKFNIFETARKNLSKDLDIINILKSVKDFEKFKRIYFDETQKGLFLSVTKPVIEVDDNIEDEKNNNNPESDTLINNNSNRRNAFLPKKTKRSFTLKNNFTIGRDVNIDTEKKPNILIDDFDKFEKKLSNLLKRKNKITILEKKILLNMGVDIDEIVKLTHLHDQEIVNVNEGNYDQIKFEENRKLVELYPNLVEIFFNEKT